MFWPATDSARFQTARWGTGSQPGAFVVGGATITSPVNGREMLAVSRAITLPDVVPIFVPGAAEELIE